MIIMLFIIDFKTSHSFYAGFHCCWWDCRPNILKLLLVASKTITLLDVLGVKCFLCKDVFLFISKFSKELKCVSSAGVPSAPEPPKMDKAGVNSIHLSWSKPESKGG